MTYAVKELFYSLQGEGANAGRPAVFCRFAGCNLWSGRDVDRADAACAFCDTDFIGTDGTEGGKYADADALADAVFALWPPAKDGTPFVICTGGEPGLQMDAALVAALHARGFEIAVETNGTQALPDGIDWVCVSPKGDAEIVVRAGNELKLVYPQTGAAGDPDRFASLAFDHFFLQPRDDAPDADATARNVGTALDYCLAHPRWRLGLQTHKITGIR